MSGIKYYVLDESEEVPYEFVVIRNVNGEPEFCASFVNTNSLAYENGVLLKLHERNDELRAESAKLRELMREMYATISDRNAWWDCMRKDARRFANRMRELGIEVDE